MAGRRSHKQSSTNDTPRICIGYGRVSTDEQAKDGQSLDVQQQRIQEFCKYKKYPLVAVVPDEGDSTQCQAPGVAVSTILAQGG